MSAIVWVVASADTAERWADAAWERDLNAHDLAWSEMRSVGDPEEHAKRMAEVGPDLVLLTSAHGVAFLPKGFGEGRAAACVGKLTAHAAQEHGFDVTHFGQAGGAELARRLVGAGPPGLVVFLRGDDVRAEGVEILERAGWRVEQVVTYKAWLREKFVREVGEAPDPRALAVGSPRAAEELARALHQVGRANVLGLPTVAIGVTTGRCLEALGFEDVVWPDKPTAEQLVAQLVDVTRD